MAQLKDLIVNGYSRLIGDTYAGNITATTFKKSGGTSSQFLKADGSVDSNTYLTTGTASSTYLTTTGIAANSSYLRVLRNSTTSEVDPGVNKLEVREIQGAASGITGTQPTTEWYHLYTAKGPDTRYATQFALGMTTVGAWYRNYSNQTWGAWKKILLESDIASWAKATSKPTYTLDEVADGSTRKLANYLPLAGGTMKGTITRKANSETTFISNCRTDNTCEASIAYDGWGGYVISATANRGVTVSSKVTASSFIKSGGTSGQFLKADGSVDSNKYVTITKEGNVLTITPTGGTAFTFTNTTYAYKDITNTTIEDDQISLVNVGDMRKWTKSGVYFVEGPSTDTTAGNWTGECSDVNALYDGLTIIYVPAVAGVNNGTARTLTNENETTVSATHTWLKFNGVWKRCYYNTSVLTTHYGKNTPVMMTYRNSLNSGAGGWQCSNYDSTDTYNLYNYYSRYYTAEAIPPYHLVAQNAKGQLIPITPTNSTSTDHVGNTASFRPGIIMRYTGSSTLAANSYTGNATCQIAGYTSAGAYNFNSCPAYCDIYLRGTYNASTGLFTLDTTNTTSWYTMVPVVSGTSATLSDYFTTGKHYILIGHTYDSANYFNIFAKSILYYFNGTGLIDGYAADAIGNKGKVTDAASDTKSYLLGHTAQNTTATATTKSTVYMQSGMLAATSVKIGEACTLQYDSTNEMVKFVF